MMNQGTTNENGTWTILVSMLLVVSMVVFTIWFAIFIIHNT